MIDSHVQSTLLQQLAYDNANEDCQALIRPIKDSDSILDYMKTCRNVSSFKYQASLNATAKYLVQEQQLQKCFNCNKPGH